MNPTVPNAFDGSSPEAMEMMFVKVKARQLHYRVSNMESAMNYDRWQQILNQVCRSLLFIVSLHQWLRLRLCGIRSEKQLTAYIDGVQICTAMFVSIVYLKGVFFYIATSDPN